MAVAKRYRVTLTAEERDDLRRMISRGKADARKLAHARILLQADEAEGGPARVDEGIASALEVSVRTIERVRQRFVEQGLSAALLPKPSERSYTRKLDGEREARLLALACGRPPEGEARWTPRLPAERVAALGHVATLSHETVRQTLKETSRSRTWGRRGASRRNSRRKSSATRRTCSRSTAALPTRDTPSCAWARLSRG